MVKIRLAKTGARNAPSYRIVAVDSRKQRDSKALEILGFYNPSHNPAQLKINKERYSYWVGVGGQSSGAVKNLVSGKYEYKKYSPAETEAKPEQTQQAQ